MSLDMVNSHLEARRPQLLALTLLCGLTFQIVVFLSAYEYGADQFTRELQEALAAIGHRKALGLALLLLGVLSFAATTGALTFLTVSSGLSCSAKSLKMRPVSILAAALAVSLALLFLQTILEGDFPLRYFDVRGAIPLVIAVSAIVGALACWVVWFLLHDSDSRSMHDKAIGLVAIMFLVVVTSLFGFKVAAPESDEEVRGRVASALFEATAKPAVSASDVWKLRDELSRAANDNMRLTVDDLVEFSCSRVAIYGCQHVCAATFEQVTGYGVSDWRMKDFVRRAERMKRDARECEFSDADIRSMAKAGSLITALR